jgi:hypothetical protein
MVQDYRVTVLPDDTKKDRFMVGVLTGDELKYIPLRGVTRKTAHEMRDPILYVFEFGIDAMHEVVRFIDKPKVEAKN